MLFYFEPSCRCDLPSSLILAPLPAKKQLWEADNEFVWKSESQREPGLQTAFGLATDGELVRLEEGKLHCSDTVLMHKSLDLNTASRSSANWEEWCAGMDGFGGLVMLAASLLG
jgi:hypothetical protein